MKQFKTSNKSDVEFDRLIFLPEGQNRKGEGGKRTKGFIKQSEVDKPLISVVTVVFNGGAHLEETIISVLKQSYENIEYIIVDGGSEDDTLDIIRRYESRIDYWVSEKDGGIYDAMNKGSFLSNGEGITFLNCGDIYVGNVISGAIPEIVLAKKKINHDSYKTLNKKAIYYGMPVSHQACVYRNNHMLYDLSLEIAADYDYTIRQNILYDASFNETDAYVLVDMNGVSARHYWKRDIENSIVIYRHFGLIRLLIFILKQVPKNIVRTLRIC